MVVDHTRLASFVPFDKKIIQFIKKTTTELKQVLIRVNMEFLLLQTTSKFLRFIRN